MVHQLKIEKEFFDDVVNGNKKFELRVADRDFKIGDILGLNVIDENGTETGRCTLAEITYILDEIETDLLAKGVVALGIIPFPSPNPINKRGYDGLLTRGVSRLNDMSAYYIHDRIEVQKDENK